MKELVEFIVKSLVDQKDEVVVEQTKDGDMNILKVTVAEQDLGKVIGRNGRIANSIRTIVKSLSAKDKQKFVVKIGEK
jgi:predicted RNA-binding protein YlqC (UPF0109 family)